MTTNILSDLFQAKLPTVIFVTGADCGPCKMMKPIFNQVIETVGDKVECYFIDAHENMAEIKAIGVNRIPYTLLIKDGAVQHRIAGSAPATGILNAIEGHLLKVSKPYEPIDFSL